jgi:hypothetical protein
MLPDPNQNPRQDDGGDYARFVDERFDKSGVLPSSPAARIVAGFKALAGLLAVLLLRPAIIGYVSKETEKPDGLVPAKARRDGE